MWDLIGVLLVVGAAGAIGIACCIRARARATALLCSIEQAKHNKQNKNKKKKRKGKGQTTRSRSMPEAFLAALLAGAGAGDGDGVAACVEELKLRLLERNVAHEVAAEMCSAVAADLREKPPAFWQTNRRAASELLRQRLLSTLLVGTGMEGAKKSDVIAEWLRQHGGERHQDNPNERQVAGRPAFTIVLAGVNGVGKSTTVAKLAHWLHHHLGLRVGVVAADTFRSGAIEQLRTHAQALGFPMYDQGYHKDPASVLYAAQRWAARERLDVLLCDTAGRMQRDKALLRQLVKLLSVNRVDRLVLVAEALAGNDVVDQMREFDRSLGELASDTKTHNSVDGVRIHNTSDNKTHNTVDGVILTKADTVGSAIGAAVSVTHVLRKPLLFLGTGQQYADLQPATAEELVRRLLS